MALRHLAFALLAAASAPLAAQQPAPATSCAAQNPFAGPAYKSVEVQPDTTVTFRLCAPDANEVRLTSPDLYGIVLQGFGPSAANGLAMNRDDMGLWSVTTPKPVPADTYRYDFRVDGVSVPDPQVSTYVHDRRGVHSLMEVPGPEGAFQAYDPKIPHGAVSEIDYWSSSLGTMRRAYVYTPPGYMNGTTKYPVLYLVHGAGDSEEAWPRTGHASFIGTGHLAACGAPGRQAGAAQHPGRDLGAGHGGRAVDLGRRGGRIGPEGDRQRPLQGASFRDACVFVWCFAVADASPPEPACADHHSRRSRAVEAHVRWRHA